MSMVRARNSMTGGMVARWLSRPRCAAGSASRNRLLAMARRNNSLVCLRRLLGRLPRGQLPEALEPLPLEVEKLAGVIVVDRLQADVGPGRA